MDLCRSAAAALAALACACDPSMLVGSDPSDGAVADSTVETMDEGAADSAPAVDADGGTVVTGDGSPIFFATSFENGFNDFGPNGADCYAGPGTAGTFNPAGPLEPMYPGPVHTGSYSGAFTIMTAAGTAWARCFLNDGLPQAAYYSAWFYILWNVTNSTGWNLLHWQRPLGDGGAVYLWDVSLVNEPDGTISPVVIDYVRNNYYDGAQAVDAGSWFHLEVYLQRSDADAGAFTMYLNDAPLVQLTDVSTDTSSSFGFHVGNYAQALTVQSSTPTGLVLYVDDVTVATQYVQNDGGLSP
ncbi:MAG TPA: hypothetical protein VK841_08535 [Polyangiaceae bacterium]|jgi:hypothetical protein|nr:hypothetical protein [Polyangiaceae bacterium]